MFNEYPCTIVQVDLVETSPQSGAKIGQVYFYFYFYFFLKKVVLNRRIRSIDVRVPVQ